MPINKKYISSFEFEGIYHVYNRTNNKELLFQTNENYEFFLNRFFKFISPIAKVYAWSLIPNHFHFLIRVNSQTEILKSFGENHDLTISEKRFLQDGDINHLAEMEFKRLFTSYAMSYNFKFSRKGNLFYRTFRRVAILDESQFNTVLIYIHVNAVKHKLVNHINKYPWTSYHLILNNRPGKLLREEILERFGSSDEFVKTHEQAMSIYNQSQIIDELL